MKKILLLAAVAIAGVGFMGFKKATKISDAVQYVTSKIGKIQGIKTNIWSGKISFLLDLILQNPTNTPINLATGSLITVRKILVYNAAHVLVAMATTNISSIAIPANGQVTIPKIPFNTTIKQIGAELQNILTPNYLDSFKVKVEIQAFNKTYTVDSPIGLNGLNLI